MIKGANYMNEYVKSDLFRYYGKSDFKTFLKAIFTNRTFRFQYTLRMCQTKGWTYYIGKMLWLFNKTKRYLQIPISTQIGYGLYIGHGGTVVVSGTAILGNNVNLSQFCTIGSNYGKAAVIGDNVYIGPNVCIVENVLIGNNVTIGAGSVVTKSISDNATAVGNYAKVINYNDPGIFIKNRWEM